MPSVFPGSLDNFSTSHAAREVITSAGANSQADAINKMQAAMGIGTGAYLLRTKNAATPQTNAKGFYISETGHDAAALITELDSSLTTPESLQGFIAGIYDEDRLVSPDPGIYKWGMGVFLVNTGTAPMTAFMARGYGHDWFGINSSGQLFGQNPQGHAYEAQIGMAPSQLTATTTNANATVTVSSVDRRGSRVEAGMLVVGANIPASTFVGVVTGRPGAPTSFTLVQADLTTPQLATGSGSTALSIYNTNTSADTVSFLASGNYGDANGNGNPNGSAFRLQSQGTGNGFKMGLSVGSTGLRSDGILVRSLGATGERVVSVEGGAYTDGVVFSSVALGDSAFEISSGVTLDSIVKIAASVQPTTAALVLPSQKISTDSALGLIIVTSATHKLGFFGRTAQVRPTVNGAASNAAGATPTKAEFDALVALTNTLRAAGLNAGAGLGLWS